MCSELHIASFLQLNKAVLMDTHNSVNNHQAFSCSSIVNSRVRSGNYTHYYFFQYSDVYGFAALILYHSDLFLKFSAGLLSLWVILTASPWDNVEHIHRYRVQPQTRSAGHGWCSTDVSTF